MNTDEEQGRLRASFGEVRREDERRAPPFERDWQAAVRLSQAARPLRFPLARVAAAVAAIAALGVAAGLLNSRPGQERPVAGSQAPRAPEPREQEAAPSIEDWESPTAALLELSLEEGSPPGHGPTPLGGHESF